MMTNADVVGRGESTRGAHEQFAPKHRVLRFLVHEMGFRTLALERQ
jgi:erythromycin esterase